MTCTNHLKRGTEVRLSNGWKAILRDNLKGNTRIAEVHGVCVETGSVYAHDIVSANVNGEWVTVEHTPAQRKLMALVNAKIGNGHSN